MKKLWLWQHTMVVGVQLFCIRNPPNYVGSLLMTNTHLAGIEPAFSSPEDDVLSIILQVQLPNYTLNGLRYQ